MYVACTAVMAATVSQLPVIGKLSGYDSTTILYTGIRWKSNVRILNFTTLYNFDYI